jgi:hypothetical protein
MACIRKLHPPTLNSQESLLQCSVLGGRQVSICVCRKLIVTTMSVSEVMIPLSQEKHIHPLPSLSYIRSMAHVEFLHDQVAVGCALLSLGCPNK